MTSGIMAGVGGRGGKQLETQTRPNPKLLWKKFVQYVKKPALSLIIMIIINRENQVCVCSLWL